MACSDASIRNIWTSSLVSPKAAIPSRSQCAGKMQAFASDEALKVEILDSAKLGKEALTCQIRFGDRGTELYLERGARDAR